MIPLESLYVKEIISVENQNLKDIISVQREHSGADGLLHSAGIEQIWMSDLFEWELLVFKSEYEHIGNSLDISKGVQLRKTLGDSSESLCYLLKADLTAVKLR